MTLTKQSRKSSTDPIQERLRQDKSDWNAVTSVLISDLIALKRGLNGRGDPKAGLPPSTIKEPLPSEVINHLQEVAARYEQVMRGAGSIIQEQKEYSQHRHQANHSNAQLSAFGSNALSRLWSKMVGWRQSNEVLRTLRLRLLDECADFVKEFREAKGLLLEQEPASIPNAIGYLASVGERYLGAVLPSYQRLESELLKINEMKAIPANDLSESEVPLEEPSSRPDQVAVQRPTIVPSTTPPPLEKTKYQFFVDQLHYANFIVRHLEKLDNLEKSNKKILNATLTSLGYRVASLFALLTQSSEGTSYTQEPLNLGLEKLLDLIEIDYHRLLTLACQLSGQSGLDFKDLASKIKGDKISTALDFAYQQNLLNKMATNAVSRWLKQQLLRINPDSQQRLLLDIIKEINTLIDRLDRLMTALENPEHDVKKLNILMLAVTDSFVEVLTRTILVGRIYVSIAERSKGHTMYIMSIRDKLRRLAAIVDGLKNSLEPPVIGNL